MQHCLKMNYAFFFFIANEKVDLIQRLAFDLQFGEC